MTTTTHARPTASAPALHFADAPAARDYIVALGRVYLHAGLPLAAAFEAALADYHAFGVPENCGR